MYSDRQVARPPGYWAGYSVSAAGKQVQWQCACTPGCRPRMSPLSHLHLLLDRVTHTQPTAGPMEYTITSSSMLIQGGPMLQPLAEGVGWQGGLEHEAKVTAACIHTWFIIVGV